MSGKQQGSRVQNIADNTLMLFADGKKGVLD
jgi:hypothetical protein